MEHYATSNRITFGKRIIPLKMIETFSPDEWEDFVEEWLDLKKKEYFDIERLGGAGDMGRDVVAYIDDPKDNSHYKWDCYQCKHYNTSITPTAVYLEFGKIIYYTFMKEYPVPQKYYFVAPKDCGTTLTNFLKDSSKLKEAIRESWSKYCEKHITDTGYVKLEGKLLSYFENFNFSIFDKIHRKVIVEEHMKHPNHLTRFGGSLPDRPVLTTADIPDEIQTHEMNYVTNLINAYNSESSKQFEKVEELTSPYGDHFKRAREGFHFAEQLRVLYRDSLPVNTFEEFQKEIHAGIINTIESTHNNGFEKVKTVEDKALQVEITSNPLKDVSKAQDRKGICHQLSNNGIINWENK